MFDIDLRTISLVLGVIGLLETTLMVVYVLISPRYHGLAIWAWMSAANTAGFILLLLRGTIADTLSIMVANALLLAAVVLQLVGVNRFLMQHHPKQERFACVLVAAVLLAFIPFTYVTPSSAMRGVLFSSSEALLLVLCTWNLLPKRSPILRSSRWFVAIIVGMNCVFHAGRALVIALQPGDFALFTPSTVQIVTFITSVAMLTLWGCGIVALTIQRLLLDLRRAQASERALLEDAERTASQRANTTRALLDMLVQHAPIGIGFLDLDLRVGIANQWFTSASSLRAHDRLTDHAPAPAKPTAAIASLAQQVIAGVTVLDVHVEQVLDSPQNPARIWRMRAYPVLLDHQVIGVGLIATDVTADRMAAAVLRDTNALLEEQVAERTVALVEAHKIVREREQLFRLTFDQSPIGAALAQLDFRFERVNDALCAITGYSEAELLRLDVAAISHPDDRAADRAAFQAMQAKEIDRHCVEKRFVRKDGVIVWVQVSFRLIRDTDEQPLYFLGLIEHITARKNAEAALQHSQQQLAQALWSAELGFWDWYLPSATLDANTQLADLLGVPLADVTASGDFWHTLVYHEDRPAVAAALAAVVAGEQPMLDCEYRIQQHDGRWHWHLVRGRAVEQAADGSALRIIGVIQDITVRKHAEQLLHERETMLRAIGDNLPDAMIYQFVRQPSGHEFFTYVSAGVERISGVTPAQVYENTAIFHALHYPAGLAEYQAAVDQSARTLEVFEYEVRKQLADGDMRWARLHAQPRRLVDGSIVWDGIEADITLHKRTEEALRQRIDELVALNRIAQALTTWTDVTAGIESVGAVLCALFHADSMTIWTHDPQEALFRRLITVTGGTAQTHAMYIPADQTALGRALLNRSSVVVAAMPAHEPLYTMCEASDAPRIRRNTLSMALRARNEPIGLLCIRAAQPQHVYTPVDVALAQTIAAVLSGALENARLFAHAQVQATEQERRRLARELHDSVSQALFSANRIAEVLPQIWELDPDEGRPALADLHRLTSSALTEMRALLVELRPHALTETPLHETLNSLVSIAASKVNTRVDAALTPVPLLPPDVQVALYRITQEALHNVSKHARADHINVHLQPAASTTSRAPWPSSVTITICDNGQGFDPSQVKAGRMGLLSMRERAEAIGALLDITSQPGAGTLVRVTWYGMA